MGKKCIMHTEKSLQGCGKKNGTGGTICSLFRLHLFFSERSCKKRKMFFLEERRNVKRILTAFSCLIFSGWIWKIWFLNFFLSFSPSSKNKTCRMSSKNILRLRIGGIFFFLVGKIEKEEVKLVLRTQRMINSNRCFYEECATHEKREWIMFPRVMITFCGIWKMVEKSGIFFWCKKSILEVGRKSNQVEVKKEIACGYHFSVWLKMLR